MAMSALVATGWAISLLICTSGLGRVGEASIFGNETFFLAWMSSYWPGAMTIEISVMSGCC